MSVMSAASKNRRNKSKTTVTSSTKKQYSEQYKKNQQLRSSIMVKNFTSINTSIVKSPVVADKMKPSIKATESRNKRSPLQIVDIEFGK